MKQSIFFVLLFFLLSCTPNGVSFSVENNSAVKPLACVISYDCSSESMVQENDPFSTGMTHVWFDTDAIKPVRGNLPDSVLLFIIDPSFANVSILQYYRTNSYDRRNSVLLYDESQSINNNPECIIAKYYLSKAQLTESHSKYKVFPPTEDMKETVRMWPPYEEVVAKYGDLALLSKDM